MPRKHNIIIVGNGLFGSVAAALCVAHGHTVTVISEKRKYEASPASGCVLAPSWLSSLGKEEVANAMSVLGSLYTLHPLEFHTNLLKTFKAQRVHTADVLRKPDIDGQVTRVGDGAVHYNDSKGGYNISLPLRGTVLVAAGIWCGELLKDLPPIRGLYGASLRIPGQLEHPKLNVYAPYRQAVGFNMDRKSIWFGDGTALIQKTWERDEYERLRATAKRARDMVRGKVGQPPLDAKPTIGARPYVEGHKAGYLQQVSPKTWVSTGGAKNGTVLAAHQAYHFLKGLK